MLLGLADKCRITAKPVVQMLQASGLECIMLTGDSDGPAHVIKQEVGLTECLSGMKPNEKFEWLQEKQVRKEGYILSSNINFHFNN